MLERGCQYEEHMESNLGSYQTKIHTDDYFLSLHGDPRFEDLRKKVGFPDSIA
jgi:hypothetical protein